MADSNRGILAMAQKQLSRTKTKVLQNLGKADKTTDDVFNDVVLRIEKQQEVAHNLQKELKMYIQCLRDMSQASRNLTNALNDVYEPDWTREASFKAQLQAFDLLWNDRLQTLHDTVVTPLINYLNTFPAMKSKIAKRGRKMVDYDNSRHNLETLQAAKKKDDVKIQKAQEEMKDAKRIYQELNNELHTELPDFINNRVTFYANLLSSLYGAEFMFHAEVGKVDTTLSEVCQELSQNSAQFLYQPKKPLTDENGLHEETVTSGSAATTPVTETSPSLEIKPDVTEHKQEADGSTAESTDDKSNVATPASPSQHKADSDNESEDGDKAEDEATYWRAPRNEPVISPPPHTLFKVMASHRYTGEDLDELNFEAGEVIYVIPFENSEDQDEGWQMGIKASDGIQGVFPENFTQRI